MWGTLTNLLRSIAIKPDQINMKYISVIGANFGDEGKGQIVDHFAKTGDFDTVVRFNGGPQAGHTVQIDGKRFVFSQIGSGTLRGLHTHISAHVLINPFAFLREYHLLKEVFGVKANVTMDGTCRVITPYDVNHNRESLQNRGHGTVGHGIHATMERNLYTPYYAHTLTRTRSENESRLEAVKNYYGHSEGVNNWWATVEEFVSIVKIKRDKHVIEDSNIIFEGAQGLALDKDSGFFPFVTPSSCGIENVVRLVGSQEVTPYYVTRSYLTRHGNGPMCLDKWEDGYASFMPPTGCDATNYWNPYQGDFRIAPINFHMMNYFIRKDISQAFQSGGCILMPQLAVMHSQELTALEKEQFLSCSPCMVYDFFNGPEAGDHENAFLRSSR